MKEDILLSEAAEPPGAVGLLEKTEVRHTQIDGLTIESLPNLINVRSFEVPGFTKSSRTIFFRKKFFPCVEDREWNDWRWQLQNRIIDLEGIEKIINLTDKEREAISRQGSLPVSITPYYASLIDPDDSFQPIRRTVIPVTDEMVRSYGEESDPLHEDDDTPVRGLMHRYPDRVLFMVTDFCSVFCRYCTRSRMVRCEKQKQSSLADWEAAFEYIEKRPEIRDVLISGGDPLTMPDGIIEKLLIRLRAIPHVEFIRIGTKVPVVLPQRVTGKLTRMLKKYHPLWMSIHFTHPDELTTETERACGMLADAGIPLGSQTVLLSGINDNVDTMKNLVHGLLKMRVKPYYLYQCDPIPGSLHFRTPLSKGLEIIRSLRGHTSGYAVPQFVVDAPGGGGKIPVNPDYVLGRDGNDVLLTNYEGKIFRYPDVSV